MFRFLRASIVALFVALLVACSSPVSGEVVDKEYTPGHTEDYMEPVYQTVCDYKGRCEYKIVYWIPKERWVDPKWRVQVREEDGDLRWATVTEHEYESLGYYDYFTNEKPND